MSKETPHFTEWYIPGPVDVRQEALDVMPSQPYGHRSDEIKPYIEDIRSDLFKLVKADEKTHSMVLTGGSGTNALEIAARSWSHPTDHEPKVLTTSIGYFGDLWADIFEGCETPVVRLRVDEGKIIDEENLSTGIQSGLYEIVTVTHNDTSTGTVNHLEKLAPIVKGAGALLFVDAVSSVGGMEIDVSNWCIDYLVTAPQKGLGVPPGLSLAVVSNEALAKVTSKNRGFTTDVLQQVEANNDNLTLTTPPEAQIGALALQLIHIVYAEGIESRYARHTQMAERTRDWANSEGFELLPELANASDTVSCFVNTREVDLLELRKQLWNNRPVQYGFDSGHPKLGKVRKQAGLPETFRIPHMGDRRPEQLEKYLEVVSSYLPE